MKPLFLSTEFNVRGFSRRLAHRGSALLAACLMTGASAPASFAGGAEMTPAKLSESSSPQLERPQIERIVPRGAFHAAIAERQQQAAKDRAEIEAFLGRSKPALKAVGIEFAQVQQAITVLDDEQAARLAERARQANQDFVAGALSNEMLTYIVIALGTAVLVLVLVV